MSDDGTAAGAAAKFGMELAKRAHEYVADCLAALLPNEGDLSITVHRWLPPGPDPLTVSNWWAYREPCDCPDTGFGRRPHGWDCHLTPIYAEMVCAGCLPTFGFGDTQ